MELVEYLLRFIDRSQLGLTVGAGSDAAVHKTKGWNVETVEFVAKRSASNGAGFAQDPAPAFQHSDYAALAGDIAKGVGKSDHYDFIVGSHAVFQQSDFLAVLKDCEAMLKEGGILTLAVPDMRFCRSVGLHASSTETVLQAHRTQPVETGATALAKFTNHAVAALDRRWFASRLNTMMTSRNAVQGDYSDPADDLAASLWNFSPATFQLVMQDLNEFGHTQLGQVSISETSGYEFFVTLKKGAVTPPGNRVELLRRVETELSAKAQTVPVVAPAPKKARARYVLEHEGTCPICEKKVVFTSSNDWLRDYFACSGCGSIPRERAVMHVLQSIRPNWRELSIHESSPADRCASLKMRTQCPGYVSSQFDPKLALGAVHPRLGYRCEDLNRQTFADASFDIVVTQDVFEHVPTPEQAIRDIARTLKPNGIHVCSVPIVRKWGPSETRATLNPDGTWTHLLPPDYHGNPIDETGSLVVTEWGYDIGAVFQKSSGMDTVIMQINDIDLGIRAEFIEILVSRKS